MRFTRTKTKQILEKYKDDLIVGNNLSNEIANNTISMPLVGDTFEKRGKLFQKRGDYAFQIENGVEDTRPYYMNVNKDGTTAWVRMTKLGKYLLDNMPPQQPKQAPSKSKTDITDTTPISNTTTMTLGNIFSWYGTDYKIDGQSFKLSYNQ
jgi:hypothetical protein